MKNFAGVKVRVGYMLACVLCVLFAASPAAFARPIGSIGAWNTNANNTPTGTDAATSVTYNGYAYILGGDTNSGRLSTVYYARLNADGSTGTWTTNAISLPNPLITEGAVVVNGYMYIIGGMSDTALQSAVYYAKINADGSIGTWTTSTHSLPQATFRAANVTNNGYIYVIGGYGVDSGGTDNVIYYTKVNADASINAWTSSTVSLPTILQDAGSFVANGYVYVLGGQDNVGTTTTIRYAKLNADGSLGSWTTNSTSLPHALKYHAAVSSNGYAYVAGGRDGSNIEQSAVYYAKINTDGSIGTWTSSGNELPQTLESSTAAIYDGYWYVFSGANSGTVENVIYSTQLGFISSNTVTGASSGKQIAVSTPAGTNLTSLTSTAVDASASSNGFSYPLDLADFTFTTDTLDNQVSLDFPTTLQPDQVVAQKYNPTTKEYTTIPGAVITETTISGEPALHVTYSIADGGPLDEDGVVNGTIVDPVTLAIAPAGASGAALTNTGMNAFIPAAFSGCILAAAIVVRTRKIS